ncbi:MAG: hypothetical protein ACJ76F_04830 [Bacteroidia bacterium]
MITAYKIFRTQVERYKPLGLEKKPFRHFFRWRRSLVSGGSTISEELPWITFEAIDYLDRHLKEGAKVFEYGGGGSTLYFLKKAKEVITVEHDKGWFEELKKLISAKNKNAWKGLFIIGEKGDLTERPDPAHPGHYSSADAASAGFNYRNYASAIDSYPNQYFDLVVVDGRSRPACLKHAISKVSKGAYLLLDNSDRPYYLEKMGDELSPLFEAVVDTYGPSPFSKDFTKTTIWKKK